MSIQALSDAKYFIVKPVFSIGLRVILTYTLWHWHINFNDTCIVSYAMAIYRCFIVAGVYCLLRWVLLSWRLYKTPKIYSSVHWRFANNFNIILTIPLPKTEHYRIPRIHRWLDGFQSEIHNNQIALFADPRFIVMPNKLTVVAGSWSSLIKFIDIHSFCALPAC